MEINSRVHRHHWRLKEKFQTDPESTEALVCFIEERSQWGWEKNKVFFHVFQFAVQTLYALEKESLRTVELSADRPYFVDV